MCMHLHIAVETGRVSTLKNSQQKLHLVVGRFMHVQQSFQFLSVHAYGLDSSGISASILS